MNTATKAARLAIYQKNPIFWKRKILKKFKERDVNIALAYINGKGTYEDIGSKYKISKERVRQIFITTLYYIARTAKYEDYMPKRNLTPLTQEEFDQIKELLYRGETLKDIIALTGRSNSTVNRIKRSETIEDFRKEGKSWGKKYKDKEIRETLPATLLLEKDKYILLDTIQEKLAVILTDFIFDEVKTASHKVVEDILRENERLKEENNTLKDQLKEATTSKFTERLKEKLHSQESLLPVIVNEPDGS